MSIWFLLSKCKGSGVPVWRPCYIFVFRMQKQAIERYNLYYTKDIGFCQGVFFTACCAGAGACGFCDRGGKMVKYVYVR